MSRLGVRPQGALVEYVADVAAVEGATGSPVLVLAPHGRRIAARVVDTVIASVFACLGFMAAAASSDGIALLVLVPMGCAAGGTGPPSWKATFTREFDRAAGTVVVRCRRLR